MASETDRALARLHLDLAHALYTEREAVGRSVEDLAAAAGLPAERIVMIEEGDTSSLTEVALLCHALQVELRLDADFGFGVIPPRPTVVRLTSGWNEDPAAAATTGFAPSPVQAPPEKRAAFERPPTAAETSPEYARY